MTPDNQDRQKLQKDSSECEDQARSPQPSPQQPLQMPPPQLPLSSSEPEEPEDQEETEEEEEEDSQTPSPREIRGWGHATICGLSGTGKTVLAQRMWAILSMKREAACFFNCAFDDYFPKENIISRIDETAARGLHQGAALVVNCPSYEVKSNLIKLHDFWMAQPLLPALTIFIDEAHLVASRGSIRFPEGEKIDQETVIGYLLATGRHINIRCVFITPKPQFIDSWVYRASRYHYIFEVDPADEAWLQSLGYSFENPTGHDYVVV